VSPASLSVDELGKNYFLSKLLNCRLVERKKLNNDHTKALFSSVDEDKQVKWAHAAGKGCKRINVETSLSTSFSSFESQKIWWSLCSSRSCFALYTPPQKY